MWSIINIYTVDFQDIQDFQDILEFQDFQDTLSIVVPNFLSSTNVTIECECNGSGKLVIGVADCNIMSINTS